MKKRWTQKLAILLAAIVAFESVFTAEGLTDTVYADTLDDAVITETADDVTDAPETDDEVINEDTASEDETAPEDETVSEDENVPEEADITVTDDGVTDEEETIVSEAESDGSEDGAVVITDEELTGEDAAAKADGQASADKSAVRSEKDISEETEDEELDLSMFVNAGMEGHDISDEGSIYEYGEGDARKMASHASKHIPSVSQIPHLRSQGALGTCYAFATIGAIECNMIKKGIEIPENTDLAELAAAYFTTHTVTDPLGGTKGDSNRYSDAHEEKYEAQGRFSGIESGNPCYTSTVAASWTGASDETKAPYSSASSFSKVTLDSSIAFDDVVHVQGVYHAMANYFRTGQAGIDSLKTLIEKYGGATMSYNAGEYWGSDKHSYYNYSGAVLNHFVTVIGWDDNYSKDNFDHDDRRPRADGAWIVKNSWSEDDYTGTSAADEGNLLYTKIFYISYYDTTLSASYAFDVEPADNYDNNYQYDLAGGWKDFYEEDEFKAANIFTVKASDLEKLSAVSFMTGEATNMDYTVKIYSNPESGDPESGTYIFAATTKGRTELCGYYTVKLRKPVYFKKGDRYAVVVEVSKKGYEVGLSCEYKTPDSNWYISVPSTKKGRGYIYDSSEGKWIDQYEIFKASDEYYGDVRIKGFTDNLTESEYREGDFYISYCLNGGRNVSGNPTSYKASSNKITFKNPTKSGYSFGGWYLDSKFTKRIKSLPSGSTGNITLYAKWNVCTYNVVFNGNGAGSGKMSKMKAAYGKSVKLTANAYKKNGYIFNGWNTKKDGSGKNYGNKARIKKASGKDGATLKLYAQWKKVYSITYIMNGGTNNAGNPSSYTGDSAILLKYPTKPGYIFTGWFTDSSYKHNTFLINKGTKGNLILYAGWKKVKWPK